MKICIPPQRANREKKEYIDSRRIIVVADVADVACLRMALPTILKLLAWPGWPSDTCDVTRNLRNVCVYAHACMGLSQPISCSLG